MKTYSDEFKDNIVARMLPPNNVSVPQLVRETGIARDTLYGWRRQAAGQADLPATPGAMAGTLSGAEKFAAAVETASLNELELGAYCRHKGLFSEQLATWRQCCLQANEPLPSPAERAERRAERERIKRLSKELQRKDRALAEAAALLVRQKKVRALWEEPADAPYPTNGASRRATGSALRLPPGPPGAGLRGRRAEPAHPPALAPRGRHQGRWPPPGAPCSRRGVHVRQPPLARAAG